MFTGFPVLVLPQFCFCASSRVGYRTPSFYSEKTWATNHVLASRSVFILKMEISVEEIGTDVIQSL